MRLPRHTNLPVRKLAEQDVMLPVSTANTRMAMLDSVIQVGEVITGIKEQEDREALASQKERDAYDKRIGDLKKADAAAKRKADAAQSAKIAKDMAEAQKKYNTTQLKIQQDKASQFTLQQQANRSRRYGSMTHISSNEIPPDVLASMGKSFEIPTSVAMHEVGPEMELHAARNDIEEGAKLIEDKDAAAIWVADETRKAMTTYVSSVQKTNNQQKVDAVTQAVDTVNDFMATGNALEALQFIQSSKVLSTEHKAELTNEVTRTHQLNQIEAVAVGGDKVELESWIEGITNDDPSITSHIQDKLVASRNKLKTALNEIQSSEDATLTQNDPIMREDIDLNVEQMKKGVVPSTETQEEQEAWAKENDPKRYRDLMVARTMQPEIPGLKKAHISDKPAIIDKAIDSMNVSDVKKEDARDYLNGVAEQSWKDLNDDPAGVTEEWKIGGDVEPPEDFFGSDFGRFLLQKGPANKYIESSLNQKGWYLSNSMAAEYIDSVTSAEPGKQLQSVTTVVESIGKNNARDLFNRLGDKGLPGYLVIAGVNAASGTASGLAAAEAIIEGNQLIGGDYDLDGRDATSRNASLRRELGETFALDGNQQDYIDALTSAYRFHAYQAQDMDGKHKIKYAQRAYRTVFGGDPVVFNSQRILPSERGENTKTFKRKIKNIHPSTYKDAQPLAEGLTYDQLLTDIVSGDLKLKSLSFNRYKVIGMGTDGQPFSIVRYANNSEFIFSVPETYFTRKAVKEFGEGTELSERQTQTAIDQRTADKRKQRTQKNVQGSLQRLESGRRAATKMMETGISFE